MFIDYDRLITTLAVLPEEEKTFKQAIQVIKELGMIELYEEIENERMSITQKEYQLECMENIMKEDGFYQNYFEMKG